MRLTSITVVVLLVGAGCSKAGQGSNPPGQSEAQGSEAMPAAHQEAAGHDHHAGHFEHRFENAEEWAARFDDPARDAWQKPARVIELLGIGPGMTVADIGAGTGYFLPHLSRAVGDDGAVLALDVEADMVRHMTGRAERDGLANVTARVVDPADPGLAAGSVDRIIIVNTWHHIAGRAEYAAKLAAALGPGGTVAIIDYTKESPHGPPKQHRLTPAEVVSELEAAGLSAAPLDEDLEHQYIVVAARQK